MNPSPLVPPPGRDLLAALLEEIPCGVALFAPDGSLLHFNKEARRLLERYPELARSHYADYAGIGIRADGSDYPVEEYPLARCLRTGQPQPAETIGFRLADGRTAWAIFAVTPVIDPADGRMAGAAVSFVDITERRATEAALKYLLEDTGSLFGEQFLASLVRHIGSTFGVHYCVVGECDPTHTEVIARAVAVGGQDGALFRYSLAGTPCADALRTGEACHHPVGVADIFPDDHLLVEMGVTGYFGMPLRDPDGTILGILVLMDLKPMPLSPEQRQLLSLLALRAGAEISRMRMDRERVRLLDLERTARAEAEAAISVRDIFLSVASHELNTPLAALQLQIDGLLRAVRGESAVTLSKERLIAALEHAAVIAGRYRRLVGTLLDATQISSTGAIVLDRAEHDLVEIVEEAIDHLSEPLARAGCDVIWSEVEHIRGSWDRFRIMQCAINLLSNAMKYGRSRPIELSVVRRGNFARLVVRDHGVGVPPKDRERIFERFERAHDRHYGGLGLGLYIVRQIVRAHGGTIHVEGAPGEGAAFHLDLPITPPPA